MREVAGGDDGGEWDGMMVGGCGQMMYLCSIFPNSDITTKQKLHF